MYQIRPDDYAAFRCLAGACPQTCCAAWEIVVDPDAQDAYLRLRHPLAEKLRRVLRVDAEGDTYFAQTDGRCPFLCADGLCELQRTLGEQSLCRTCRDFPRWEVCCATGWSGDSRPRARRPRGGCWSVLGRCGSPPCCCRTTAMCPARVSGG